MDVKIGKKKLKSRLFGICRRRRRHPRVAGHRAGEVRCIKEDDLSLERGQTLSLKLREERSFLCGL